MATRDTAAPISLRASRRRYSEDIVRIVLLTAAFVSVITTFAIIISLLRPAIEFFTEVSPWDFLTGTTWTPLFLDGEFGAVPCSSGRS